jgi:hypothetical protein
MNPDGLRVVIDILRDLLTPSFVGIAAYLIGLATVKLRSRWRARKSRAMLRLKGRGLEVILPTREGRVATQKGKTSPRTQYVTLNEVEIVLELRSLLNIQGRNQVPITLTLDSRKTSPDSDLFYIGGMFANSAVLPILTQCFEGFKVACSPDSYRAYPDLHAVLTPVATNSDERWLELNHARVLTFDRHHNSYIILARLSGWKHFGDRHRGTTHILFGSDAVATLAAVKCYTEHLDALYARIRTKAESYMVAMLCDKKGEVDFNSLRRIV